ncbi:pollen-specific leucine-rich repeat extensin-like protein 1 [Girardinichthys multiradiatus]|uniref:pollen-specific leucine-rich repeat extensin-like protein 1 n=1 Tax=Girardinichthys multiradiatus TaxID=208333 RepID=UPI001FAE4CD0|nr:pollen-specific leucine-rich repeat extensin-like protein 1 [Girardinichthys multiradiatus]
MHAPQTNESRPPGPARQSSRPCDAPPCPALCPREKCPPSKQKGGTERPQHAQQRGRTPHTPTPPKTQTHQHPCQPSKNDPAKPSCGSPRANATATPHILPYIGRGMVKTTNPKHTPPTRNHPADKQTPPHYKAEKPNATAEPSDAHPAAPTLHSCTGPPPQHHSTPNSRGQNAAMSTQSKSRAQSPHHANAPQPALQKQRPLGKCTLLKGRPTASRSKNMPDPHTPARSSPARKPTPKPTKGREPTKPKQKPTKKPRSPRNQPRPARPPKSCRPIQPPSPRQDQDQHQEPEPRQGTRIQEAPSSSQTRPGAAWPPGQ